MGRLFLDNHVEPSVLHRLHHLWCAFALLGDGQPGTDAHEVLLRRLALLRRSSARNGMLFPSMDDGRVLRTVFLTIA